MRVELDDAVSGVTYGYPSHRLLHKCKALAKRSHSARSACSHACNGIGHNNYKCTGLRFQILLYRSVCSVTPWRGLHGCAVGKAGDGVGVWTMSSMPPTPRRRDRYIDGGRNDRRPNDGGEVASCVCEWGAWLPRDRNAIMESDGAEPDRSARKY